MDCCLLMETSSSECRSHLGFLLGCFCGFLQVRRKSLIIGMTWIEYCYQNPVQPGLVKVVRDYPFWRCKFEME